MTDFIITSAQLLDAAAGKLRPGASVRVEGDRIVEVAEDGAPLQRPEDVEVIDAGIRTLMPGLIDAHVHAALTTTQLEGAGRGIEPQERAARLQLSGYHLAGGVSVPNGTSAPLSTVSESRPRP